MKGVLTADAGGAEQVADTGQDRAAALAAAHSLERWGRTRLWRGTDPYDALNATRLATPLRRTATGRRALIQVVKRCPVDLRRLLGVPLGTSAAALAWVASAYAIDDGSIADDSEAAMREALEGLWRLRIPSFSLPCWGYHFDVQTRVFFYPRSMPNTIATAFAGHAFIDAYERTKDPRWLAVARGTAEFFRVHVPATETDQGIFFGYLVGDRTPIHNASLLVCSMLARLAQLLDWADLARIASAGVAYTLAHQRPDGSWPYGEQPHLAWIDNFHTGYVLEALMRCRAAGMGDGNLDAALERGLHYYRHELFCDDGAPKYFPSSLYPIDSQCVAQGIQTFAIAAGAGGCDPRWPWRIARFGIERMRRADGAFRFQRRRFWANSTPHVRWCQAPMLLALAHLLSTAHR